MSEVIAPTPLDDALSGRISKAKPFFRSAVCNRLAETHRLEDDATTIVVCRVCGIAWGLDKVISAGAVERERIKAKVKERLLEVGAEPGPDVCGDDLRDLLKGVAVFYLDDGG